MHYVRDWEVVLGEFRRVLKPEGAVVFSTHHPALDWQLHAPEDYFAVKHVTETWSKGSGRFEVSFWRRPLTAMGEAIASAGFVIERLAEPAPLAELADRTPPPTRCSARSRGSSSSACGLLPAPSKARQNIGSACRSSRPPDWRRSAERWQCASHSGRRVGYAA